MARELEEINSSGELADVKLGGTSDDAKLLTAAEIAASQSGFQTKAYIDEPVFQDYVPQASDLTHKAGRVFYDQVNDTIASYNSESDIKVLLGQENLIPVYNDSGATISNGAVCYQFGIGAGRMTPRLALADDYYTSQSVGIATHDIASGAVGFLCGWGLVGGVDTSAWVTGTTLYLSSTVPGGYTDAPPDLASRIGRVVASGVDGSIFIDRHNVISIPSIIALMQSTPNNYNLTDVYQDIVNYQAGSAVRVPYNLASGEITLPAKAYYRVSGNYSLEVDDSTNQTRGIYIRAIGDQGGAGFVDNMSLPKDEVYASGAFSIPGIFEGGETVKLQISSNPDISDVVFHALSFDVESIRFVP